MRNVFAYAAEAELAALFHNGQEAAVIHQTLLEMGHPQPPIPIKTDNSTADGIANRSVIQRKLQSMDMHFLLGSRSSLPKNVPHLLKTW